MPHRVRRWMGILLACLGGMAAAQPAPDAGDLRRDGLILENLVALALDQAQARSILELSPAAFAEAAKIAAAQRKYYLETRDAAVAIEWAMIRGEPLDPAQFDTLDAAANRLARVTDRSDKQIDLTVQKITARLTDKQRALIEPDADCQKRMELERQRRLWRREAVASGAAELAGWVREASDAAYAEERALRAAAIVQLGWRDQPPERLQGLTTQLLGVYDQVRRMSAPQFVEYRRKLDDTLGRTLFPPETEPVRRFVMAEFEWRRFWQDKHVSELLAQLLPALPQGDAR